MSVIITESSSSGLVLRLRLPSEQRDLRVSRTIQTHLGRFVEILDQHQSLTDALSLGISRWGSQVSSLILDRGSLSEEDFIQAIADKVEELRKRILINPLDRAPLQEPLLVNDEVWEGWMLRHYRALSRYSPYDRRVLGAASPHIFAKEMIAWLEEVVQPSEDRVLSLLANRMRSLQVDNEQEGRLDPSKADKIDPNLALAVYQELAEDALSLKKEEEKESYYLYQKARFDRRVEAIDRQITHNMNQLQSALTEMTDSFEERLRFIQDSHARTVRGLKDLLAFLEQANQRLEYKLSDAEAKVTNLEGRISSLEVRLRQAEAQNEQNRQAANDGGGGGGCIIM